MCELGREAVEKMQEDCIKKYGWYAHYIMDDNNCPANTNAHTHHVLESFGHKDFQICLNVKPEIFNMIFTSLVDEVKKGAKYESGKKYGKIIDGYKVEFIDAIESGRSVLRVLIPDENGKYKGPYAVQLTKLNNAEFNPNLN
jgi:thiaminase